MKLQVPTLEQCQKVRLWRNESMESLRTPYELTEEMQEDFYRDVICNRNSPHRYWSIITEPEEFGKTPFFIGFGGITNIQWENRLGEISLIISPSLRQGGLGQKAVDLLLDKAFNYMNLHTVCGECYCCNPAKDFWKEVNRECGGTWAYLPDRKYWNGSYYNSLYFSFDKGSYVK